MKKFALIKRAAFSEPIQAELDLGVTVVDGRYAVGDPRRYGALADGTNNDTVPVQAAFDVVAELANYSAVDFGGLNYLVDTLSLDGRDLTIRHGSLTASANIPASGAIILSLAGGSDTTNNQGVLDPIYGTSVQSVRTKVPGSMENVHIDDVKFIGGANAIKGFWATGFTRGCRVMGCHFEGCDEFDIAINGSWTFSLINNLCEGDGTNGTGIGLGVNGNGQRSGTSVVNAPFLSGNECTGHNNGMIWNFGSGGSVSGNTFEVNVTDGFASQSVVGIEVLGNYFENNDGDNLDLGGTNGVDFVDGWVISGNHFQNSSGHNIRLDGVKNCRIGPNHFGGSSAHYFLNSGGGGVNVLDNEIYVPGLSSTYITNLTELDASTNDIVIPGGKKPINTQNGNYTFTLRDPALITRKASGGAGETWTIPANSSVPFAIGSVLEGVNNGGGTLTIAITTDTLTHTAGTGSRTIADGGHFRIKKVASTSWSIEGSGIT